MNFLLKTSVCLVALVAVAASPASAQDAFDPIGALLDQSPAMDEDQAEQPPAPRPAPQPAPQPAPVAPIYTPPPRGPVPYTPGPVPYTPRPVAPYNPAPSTYAPQAYVRPPAPKLTAPVHVDEYDKSPEAPLNPAELGYETRLRSSFASAQGMQGPLDGAWTLSATGGQPLYSLLFVDKGRGQLEGAWRDPRRPGATNSSGFMTGVERVGGQLVARFQSRPGAALTSVTVSPGTGGVWTGVLDEAGARTSVTLKRD